MFNLLVSKHLILFPTLQSHTGLLPFQYLQQNKAQNNHQVEPLMCHSLFYKLHWCKWMVNVINKPCPCWLTNKLKFKTFWQHSREERILRHLHFSLHASQPITFTVSSSILDPSLTEVPMLLYWTHTCDFTP